MVFCHRNRTGTRTDMLLDSMGTFSSMHVVTVTHRQWSLLLDGYPAWSNNPYEDMTWFCFFTALPKERASNSKFPSISVQNSNIFLPTFKIHFYKPVSSTFFISLTNPMALNLRSYRSLILKWQCALPPVRQPDPSSRPADPDLVFPNPRAQSPM